MAKSDFDSSIFKEISKTARIKDVIEYELGASAVIKKGKDYVCLCPFHNDHSPSMQINVRTNQYHCWVDNHHGDAINFVQEYEHISPLEALKKVCLICSIPLPDSIHNVQSKAIQKQAQYKNELNALLELKKFYQTYLQTNEGQYARDYLAKRKIPEESIKHFSLGLAPLDASVSIKILRKAGFEVSTLEKAGILSNSGDLLDRYSSRLMYPIEDDYGNLVGFSGRKLNPDQSGGKYINYPTTELFNKSEILYHFNQAKDVARKKGYIYVVEGFNDVIAFYRAGHENCVASMGTALTLENVKSLKKLGVEVRLCLDGDEPGQEAMEECLPQLLAADVPFRIVKKFKNAKDADEILANFSPNGKEELDKQINRLIDPVMFLLGRYVNKYGSNQQLTDSKAINDYIQKAAPYYLKLNLIDQQKDLNWIAKITKVDSKTLEHLFSSQKDIDLNKEKTFNKDSYQKDNYVSKRYSSNNNYPQNLVSNTILPKENDHSRHILACREAVKNTSKGNQMIDKLIQNETEIVFVLPHSRNGYKAFSNAHIDFFYKPFRKFVLIIDQIYRADYNLKQFAPEHYQKISDFLEQYDEVHQIYLNLKDQQTADEAFDTDLFDTNIDELIEIPNEDNRYSFLPLFNDLVKEKFDDEDLSILKTLVTYTQASSDSCFGENELKKQLEIHKPLKGYNEELLKGDKKDSLTLRNYQMKLKELGISVKSSKK